MQSCGWVAGGWTELGYAHNLVLNLMLTDRLSYIAQSDDIRTDNPGISTFDVIGLNNYLIYRWSDLLAIGARHEWWKADGISFNAITGGVNINLSEDIVVRPEIRHDWAPGIGLKESTVGIDMIVKY